MKMVSLSCQKLSALHDTWSKKRPHEANYELSTHCVWCHTENV